jgi:hypothetical protein
MERGQLKKAVVRACLSGCLIFLFSVLSGQGTDFSGMWQLDLTKSDANFGKYYSAMTCVIKQSAGTISIERISVDKAGKKSSADPAIHTLDGREMSKEQFGGVDKYSAMWSADKKNLTLRSKRTVNGADYGSNESYSLSSGGKILTVTTTDLTGGSKIVEVYILK